MKRQEVYRLLKNVPKDKVTTYKEIANAAGTHPRAVAVFMKTNKDPEHIPCFRVIRSDGNVGGYSGIGGTAGKIQLLRKHGIEVAGGRVPEKYIHRF